MEFEKPTKSQRKQLRALAHAMLKGAKKRKKGEAELFTIFADSYPNRKPKIGASCALGAAFEGVFGLPSVQKDDYDDGGYVVDGGEDAMYAKLARRFTVLEKLYALDGGMTLGDTIVDWNDWEHKPRAWIAKQLLKLAKVA